MLSMLIIIITLLKVRFFRILFGNNGNDINDDDNGKDSDDDDNGDHGDDGNGGNDDNDGNDGNDGNNKVVAMVKVTFWFLDFQKTNL